MAEPSKDDAARALERLTSPEAPTPQPRPRTVAKPMPRPGTPTAPQKTVRAAAPKPKPPSPPSPNLQEALAGHQPSAIGVRKPSTRKSDGGAFALQLKRTLIPILLTTGFILVSLATVHFAWKSDDNPVIELPILVIVLMFVAGALSWGVAAFNMVSVKRALQNRD